MYDHEWIAQTRENLGTKATNPKDAVGTKKLPFSVVPFRALAGVALALLSGALEYRRHNYRIAGVRASVYFDANLRHMAAWWEGEDLDPKTNLCHVDHAIAGLLVLRDSMLQGNWQDDRPPRARDEWVAAGNADAARLIAAIPEPAPPHTEIGK